MAFRLLLVGAGQLGSRYLQGFAKSSVNLKITVVDTSTSALKTARSRWVETGGELSHHQVQFADAVPSELKYIDLLLVVTSAKGRAALIEKLASQIEVRFWVLEKVLAQSVNELAVITRVTSRSRGVWVNTPRRMMSWHQALKDAFAFRSPIKFTYSGGLWGLACNGVHFLDLISWWTGEKLESIDTSSLDSFWCKSKRAGYFEVTGKLIAQYSGGRTLILEARNSVEVNALRIDLADGTVWTVDEANGIAISSGGERIHGCIEFQSLLTARLVDKILLRGHCDLPTLRESAAIHSVFLEVMLKHWNFSQNRNDIYVPIT